MLINVLIVWNDKMTPVLVLACKTTWKFTYLLWDEKVFRIDISFTIAALFSLSTAKSLFRAYFLCLVSMSTTSYTNANPPSPILQIWLKTLLFKCWIIFMMVILFIWKMFLKKYSPSLHGNLDSSNIDYRTHKRIIYCIYVWSVVYWIWSIRASKII